MTKLVSTFLLLVLVAGVDFKSSSDFGKADHRFPDSSKPNEEFQSGNPGDGYEADVQRLIALRSRPQEELLALAAELEGKWRKINWTQYAQMMTHVCSEIVNYRLNDAHLRQQSEHYAVLALSHSKMIAWPDQSELVFALGYQRSSETVEGWLHERREKTQHWLEAWHRLEIETDPGYDLNDRRNRPAIRVLPPDESGLPPGAPPSAIRDPKLRRQYEIAIAENQRKAEKALKQMRLQTDGPFFKSSAEHVLVELYSQQPYRTNELKQYLQVYVRDAGAKQRIVNAVAKKVK
jgi:hypothetical protein